MWLTWKDSVWRGIWKNGVCSDVYLYGQAGDQSILSQKANILSFSDIKNENGLFNIKFKTAAFRLSVFH